MCAEGFEGVFCHNSRNLRALDALVTERAWLTTILAARQYYHYAKIRTDRRAGDFRALGEKRAFGQRKKPK